MKPLQREILQALIFHCKIVIIDAPPLFVVVADVIVNVGTVPKVFVARRAAVVRTSAKVLIAQVPLHVDLQTNPPPANHADKTAVALLNLGQQKLLRIEDP